MAVRGFFEVPLAKVEVTALPNRWPKDSPDQIREHIKNLKTIQEMRERGYTREDFGRMFHSADPGEKALGITHDRFYTNSVGSIQLSWQGDHYQIERGAHRVPIAKEMGLTHIPASVIASDMQTLQQLQAEGRPIDRESAVSRTPQAQTEPSVPDIDNTPVWERSAVSRIQCSELRER
jgi:hypothetical protein